MPNLPISGLPSASALDGTELLPFVQGGITTQATAQDILDANLPVTSSGIVLSGDIIPATPQGATLGSIDKPFADLFLQSGSISLESDTPGDPSAIISNKDGNLEISVGGMLLVESGSAFTAPTGSFNKLSANLPENYVWIGDSNNRNTPISASGLATYLTSSFITPSQTGSLVNTVYGLFNQTGSSTPISASVAELNLLDGGVGTLTVPANGFTKGDAYHAILTGRCTFHNGDTLQIKVKAGSVVLADTGLLSLANASNKHWQMDINFAIREVGGTGTASIAAGGKFNYSEDQAGKINETIFSTENSSSFDTTISNTLVVTGQFNHNDNIIYSDLFTLTKTY
jgi:hypothetical protein